MTLTRPRGRLRIFFFPFARLHCDLVSPNPNVVCHPIVGCSECGGLRCSADEEILRSGSPFYHGYRMKLRQLS